MRERTKSIDFELLREPLLGLQRARIPKIVADFKHCRKSWAISWLCHIIQCSGHRPALIYSHVFWSHVFSITLLTLSFLSSTPLSPNFRQRSVKLVSRSFKVSLSTQSTASYSLLRLCAYCKAISLLPTPPSPCSAREQKSRSGLNRCSRLSICSKISVRSKNLFSEARGRLMHGRTASSGSSVLSKERAAWRLDSTCFCAYSLACRMDISTLWNAFWICAFVAVWRRSSSFQSSGIIFASCRGLVIQALNVHLILWLPGNPRSNCFVTTTENPVIDKWVSIAISSFLYVIVLWSIYSRNDLRGLIMSLKGRANQLSAGS